MGFYDDVSAYVVDHICRGELGLAEGIENTATSPADDGVIGWVYRATRYIIDIKGLANKLRLFRQSEPRSPVWAWMLSRESIGTDATGGNIILENHRFTLRGYHGMHDGVSGHSENFFQECIDRVRDRLNEDYNLGGLVLRKSPAQAGNIGHRMYAGTLCHYAEITFVATEARDYF